MLHNFLMYFAMHFKWYVYLGLSVVSFIASTVDTLAGGGGIIALPAILLTGMNPVIAFGTNKLQAVIGESSASMHFIVGKHINYYLIYLGVICAIIGSIIGTLSLSLVPVSSLEKLIPFFLLAILIYYVLHQRKIHHYSNTHLPSNSKWQIPLGLLIGSYNGFFGPGTGSIWIVALMRAFKLNIRAATMYAKPLNVVGNLAALVIFIATGRVDFLVALIMGMGACAGAKFGAKLVIYQDLRILKAIFLFMMSLSTCAAFIKYYT